MDRSWSITDDEFGTITVTARARVRNVSVKVRAGGLCAVVPQGACGVDALVLRLIDEHRPALRRALARVAERQQEASLHDGKVIHFYGGGVITVTCTTAIGNGRVRIEQIEGRHYRLLCRAENLADERFVRALSRYVLRFVSRHAAVLLPPLVHDIAGRNGISPLPPVLIGRGQKVLGHCSSQGVITLSAFVMFLPDELVRYVICHELAHLTHFDHSPQFHALCNSYCGGNERRLQAALRQNKFPLRV